MGGASPLPPAPTPGSLLTSGHHDVGQAHGGLDVLVKGWLDKLVVLLDDTHNVAATLTDVPAKPSHKADIRVRIHKDLHVQELEGSKPLLGRLAYRSHEAM